MYNNDLTELLSWNYIDKYSANIAIDLPSGWNDVYFIVKSAETNTYTIGQNMIANNPYLPFINGKFELQGGFFLITANAGGYMVELTNDNKLTLKSAWAGGSNVTSSAKIYVYYR